MNRRPAESAGLAGAASLLIGRAAGIKDPDVLTAIGVVVASIPAVVTWLVELARSPRTGPPPPSG